MEEKEEKGEQMRVDMFRSADEKEQEVFIFPEIDGVFG